MGPAEGNSLDRALAAEVADWRRRGLGRSVEDCGAAGGVAVDFTSNDYRGMAGHPAVCAAASAAAERHGAGGRAARLLGGGSPATAEVETQLARWVGAEGALLLPSGYQANLTLMAAIAGPSDVVVSDEDNHASLIDGIRLSRARVKIYRHGDAAHAAELLAESRDVHPHPLQFRRLRDLRIHSSQRQVVATFRRPPHVLNLAQGFQLHRCRVQPFLRPRARRVGRVAKEQARARAVVVVVLLVVVPLLLAAHTGRLALLARRCHGAHTLALRCR